VIIQKESHMQISLTETDGKFLR